MQALTSEHTSGSAKVFEAQTMAIDEVERRRPKEGDEVDLGDVVHSISIQFF